MLKFAKVELEFLTDPEMLVHIESVIKGSVSQSSNRNAKVNNRYLVSIFYPNLLWSYIFYFDIDE